MVYYPAIHNISQILQEKTHTKAPKVMLQISWTTNGAGVFRCRDFELHPGFVSSTTKSSTGPMNLWWKATRSNINSKENAGTSFINQIECYSVCHLMNCLCWWCCHFLCRNVNNILCESCRDRWMKMSNTRQEVMFFLCIFKSLIMVLVNIIQQAPM